MNILITVVLGLLVLCGVVYVWLMVRYNRGRRKVAACYAAMEPQVDSDQRLELGEVERLSILPLVDFYAADQPAGLETEAGVAYLIRANDKTILFDLGYNRHGAEEPPLLQNMQRLGIDPGKVDFIVNSHPHMDHLSGSQWQSLARRLAGKALYATVPLDKPGFDNRVVERPQALAPGVGTTGPLPVQLFTFGYTLEQSLVVNVVGKGLVVIIGCGHPGVERILQRASQVFKQPIYGVIGGLHLLVAGDRSGMRLPMQKLLGSAEPPWQPAGEKAVFQAIDIMKSYGVKLVSLSAHDSCDWTLKTFADGFGDAYRPLRVGDEIKITSI